MRIKECQPRLRAVWLLAGLLAPLAHAGLPGIDDYGATAALDSEVVHNFHGGIDDGTGGNTLGYVGAWADLSGGGHLRIAGTAFYGNQPGGRYVGDFQGVSNIEAPRRERLFELWYGQDLGDHWNARLGLIPADNYFGVTDSASLLLNASFGTPGTWDDRIDAPVYPTAGVGAMASWHNGAWSNRAGVFQADPRDRSSVFQRGAFYLDEVAYHGGDVGTYKVGVWNYRPHAPERRGLADQSHGAWISAEHGLGGDTTGFLRAGLSPDNHNPLRREFQAGILAPSPLAARPDDEVSLGVTRADLRGTGAETTWEATWLLALTKNLSLQPDLQYVHHPGGDLDSAVVGLVRLHVEVD